MMTDEQVIDRAVKAGWVWLDAPNRWGNSPGWQTSDHSFASCDPSDPHAKYGSVSVAQAAFAHGWDCRECGRPINVSHGNSDQLKTRRECFDCNFWARLVKDTTPGERVVVGGVHFIAGEWSETPPDYRQGKCLGFGGRKFVVRFTAGPNEGKTLTTYNLWHQGPIPERFRDRLPDNAVFVENTSDVRPD